MKYCAREFTADDIQVILDIISQNPKDSRRGISRKVCEALDWYKQDGGLKDMSCRVALLRMEKDGLIKQPPPKVPYRCNHRMKVQRSLFAGPQPEVIKPAGEYDIRLEIVSGKTDSALWNEYIDRYHYLGYCPLPGAQLRYFIKSGEEILALLGFGASAWKVASRDTYIEWTSEQRKQNLHLIVNNNRFLILPWINSRNLASKILGMIAKQLPKDWQNRYNYQPVLMETFVEIPRFKGTCYNAANWVYLGKTKGRGKLDRYNKKALPIKTVWVYPLRKKFRKELCTNV
ncbi:DUF4338 domain-containing protein [bacterium]|nr:DUF4338 domain-containing protein [Candidatus Neomarinimicrobiota bacterium]MCK5684316.1 DUF4338 domain-containing protein [bacterium]